ncbi:hypothetical protein K439DRAFT_1618963 [Ramaria rubella]|nr:hypothetical protein K439DRAFT_1618963 [Ramaria rubella]
MAYKTKIILVLTTATGTGLALVGTILDISLESRIPNTIKPIMVVAGTTLVFLLHTAAHETMTDLEGASETPGIMMADMQQPEIPSASKFLQNNPGEEEDEMYYGVAI